MREEKKSEVSLNWNSYKSDHIQKLLMIKVRVRDGASCHGFPYNNFQTKLFLMRLEKVLACTGGRPVFARDSQQRTANNRKIRDLIKTPKG